MGHARSRRRARALATLAAALCLLSAGAIGAATAARADEAPAQAQEEAAAAQPDGPAQPAATGQEPLAESPATPTAESDAAEGVDAGASDSPADEVQPTAEEAEAIQAEAMQTTTVNDGKAGKAASNPAKTAEEIASALGGTVGTDGIIYVQGPKAVEGTLYLAPGGSVTIDVTGTLTIQDCSGAGMLIGGTGPVAFTGPGTIVGGNAGNGTGDGGWPCVQVGWGGEGPLQGFPTVTVDMAGGAISGPGAGVSVTGGRVELRRGTVRGTGRGADAVSVAGEWTGQKDSPIKVDGSFSMVGGSLEPNGGSGVSVANGPGGDEGTKKNYGGASVTVTGGTVGGGISLERANNLGTGSLSVEVGGSAQVEGDVSVTYPSSALTVSGGTVAGSVLASAGRTTMTGGTVEGRLESAGRGNATFSGGTVARGFDLDDVTVPEGTLSRLVVAEVTGPDGGAATAMGTSPLDLSSLAAGSSVDVTRAPAGAVVLAPNGTPVANHSGNPITVRGTDGGSVEVPDGGSAVAGDSAPTVVPRTGDAGPVGAAALALAASGALLAGLALGRPGARDRRAGA